MRELEKEFSIVQTKDYARIEFKAMASPCEILVRSNKRRLLEQVAIKSVSEIRRFESKYSRYRDGNLCWQMNHSHGQVVPIDRETFSLLEFAKNLYQLSAGMFDITSGVLRKIWHFRPNAGPPTRRQIESLLPLIDFTRVSYDERNFSLPKNMEIDFGGIGKEYCVDRVAQILSQDFEQNSFSFLINLGGDLFARCRGEDSSWKIGLDTLSNLPLNEKVIELSLGGVATSGSTQRSFVYQGKRYAHILNPKTGYPIEGAPKTVTVMAANCTLAGGMSTLAQLKASDAESFLAENRLEHICVR